MALSPLEELDLHWKEEDPTLGIMSEGVQCKDMNEIIEHISKVKDTVKKISLKNQPALTEIPDILKECAKLEELNVSHTKITSIPEFIFSLPNLRVFSCCCRELPKIPSGLAKAQKLEKLHIRINEKWNFPEDIASLSELKILTLDIYSSAAFIKDLKKLTKLEELKLSIKYESGAALTLPDSFMNHQALKKVTIVDIIYKNYKILDFERTAQILSSCPQFESLTLFGFTIKKPNNLSKLTSLKVLELRHLKIEGKVFDSIKDLKKLEKLDIFGSEFNIYELPDIFGNYSELRSFSFAGNFVRKLPPSLFLLNNLTTLEIGSTGISVIDEKVGNLKNLTGLQIYDNMLEKLPNSIFTLPKLAVLNIEQNFIKQQDIAAIKQKLAELSKKGQQIEFTCGDQGHRLTVKKLRALNFFESINSSVYYSYCMAAMYEKPSSIKYVRDNFLKDNEYIQVCLEAALRNIYPDFLVHVNHKRLKREDYERICWAAILHLPSTISKMVEPTKELQALAAKRF
ncbi:leucine-rich repeat domain-containing protein [Treponema sp. R80B11-R83G3]